jgi:hypothetical protein
MRVIGQLVGPDVDLAGAAHVTAGLIRAVAVSGFSIGKVSSLSAACAEALLTGGHLVWHLPSI